MIATLSIAEYKAGYRYTLTYLDNWMPECGQSHVKTLLVEMVVYADRKSADFFMNEWSADFHNHQ